MVHFIHPERLWLFAAWGLLVLWAIRSRWRRRRSWAALAQRGRPPREGALWWLAAIACLIAALAQPKWDRIGPAPAPGHDVVLMIDVSRSMGAEDAVPNRLAVAVEYAEKLVDALGAGPDNRAAIVAFAGCGECYCPLTENLGAVKEILHRLRPGCLKCGGKRGGTDLAEGLDAALEAMGNDEHAEGQSIVVLSDGEDLAEQWKSRLEKLRQREVVVYAVTIGDAERGHAVPMGMGAGQPMVYRGKAVESRRSDAALREIAEQTRGLVIPLGLSSGDASLLYRKQIEPSARRRGQVPRIADMADRFPLFLVTALSCLIAACWPPGRGWPWPWRLGWSWGWSWGGIRPWGWFSRSGPRRRAAALTRVALVLASAGLVLAVGAAQPPEKSPGQPEVKAPVSTPSPGTTKAARQAVSQGRDAYEKGQMEEALAAFEAAVRAAPTAAVPRYNSAAVLFRLGRFEEARSRYNEARALADAALGTKIDYALGNTALALGDVPGAIESYDACIASTSRGADLEIVRQDAAINRDFAYQKAQSPTIPKGPDDPSPSKRPDGRRSTDRDPGGEDPSAGGNDETSPSTEGDNPDEADQKGRDRARRRRRAGGAGGGQTTPPGASGESLNDRLDAALDNIRAAQSRRLPDEPPPPSPGSDGRDW